MKVLNFGSLNYDYVYKVDHAVTPGETMDSFGMDTFLGGKGLNQSISLARAGVKVYHAGQIGRDGEMFLDVCKKSGIDTSYIKMIEGKSGHAIIQLDKNAQNCILLYGGSNRKITKEFVDEVLSHFEKGDILLLQNEINDVPYIIERCHERGIRVAFNAAMMVDAVAQKLVDEYIDYLAESLTDMINIFQPAILCIGGGICNEGETLLAPVRAFIDREQYAMNSAKKTKVCKAQLGNDAGIIGAALLGKQED